MTLNDFAKQHPRLIKQLRRDAFNEAALTIMSDHDWQRKIKDIFVRRIGCERAEKLRSYGENIKFAPGTSDIVAVAAA
jgi:hypothetical protein